VEVYLTGVWIALFIGLSKVCIVISILLSQKAKNLKKINLYYNCTDGAFNSTEPFSKIKVILYLFYLLVIAPIFSWLSVLSATLMIIVYISNRTHVPEEIKSVRFKIAHIDLSKDQMIEIRKEIFKILGIEAPVGAESDSTEPMTTRSSDT